jgi:indole-3-glycerol phosphate synthase/phosphoribosylanthranilate isomerase
VLLGENKVCGLTREQDAQAAYEAGAIYGGLIFVDSSPRAVNESRRVRSSQRAAQLRRRVPQCADADVAAKADAYLSAVQLHGMKTRPISTPCAPRWHRCKSGKR